MSKTVTSTCGDGLSFCRATMIPHQDEVPETPKTLAELAEEEVPADLFAVSVVANGWTMYFDLEGLKELARRASEAAEELEHETEWNHE